MDYRHDLGNDRWIAEVVYPGKRDGFFLEAGATNGVNGSATLVLERHLAWKGICVEVIPRQYERLAEFRACLRDNRALWKTSGETLQFNYYPERSGLSGLTDVNKNADSLRQAGTGLEQLSVETVSLQDLLAHHEAPEIVDYVCLDIEGAEAIVLGAFNFDGPHRVMAMSIEGHACDEIMRDAGYKMVENPFTDVTFETYWLHPAIG